MALPQKPNCATNKIIGKYVAVDINWELCGNVADPRLIEFKPLGGMQSKGIDRSQSTEDVTDDQTIGDYAEMIGTIKSWTFSGSGIMNHTDSETSNLETLDKLYSQDGPTFVHVRITEPHITTYAYCLVTNFSKDWPSTAPITFDLELVATTSAYGVKTYETAPIIPTGLSFGATELEMSEGAKMQLTPIIEPVNAKRSLLWETSDDQVATVNQSGIVEAVAAGNATITATHLDDDQVSATINVVVV